MASASPTPKATKEIAQDPAGYRAALEASAAALAGAEWTAAGLEHALRALAEARGVPAGNVFQPIRIALTGGTVSEPVNERGKTTVTRKGSAPA